MSLDRILLALMAYRAYLHLGDSIRLKAKGIVYHDRLLNHETEFEP